MKIGFSLNIEQNDADSGKQFFIRLAKEMKNLGIDIDNKKPDVYLRLDGDKPNKKAKINVLRLDGLWFNISQDYKKRNKNIIKSIKESDALIYQSNFCYKAYHNFLGIDKKYSIIFNGADPNDFLSRQKENLFLANCKWRPHKRLNCIIDSFLLALDKGIDSDLIITGNIDKKINHPKIKYIGWQNSDNIKIFLSKAIASLHLTWLDWCPNAMIESIVSNCPVIYSASGGHIEIGSGCGISIKDTDWNFKVCDLYNPPPINIEEVANAIIQMKDNLSNNTINNERFYISTIAKQYLFYFKKLTNQ
jgi:hypothetical protein